MLLRTEGWLLKVPVFRTIYAPVKQLVVAFSPDNEYGFKRVVLIEDAKKGYALGFLEVLLTALPLRPLSTENLRFVPLSMTYVD